MPYLLEDTTIDDILKTVEALHTGKDYAGAVSYLEKHRGHLPQGLWHFNMGTMNAKLEKWPEARFHFLMAEEQGFSPDLVTNNKFIIEEKLNLSKLEKPITTSDFFYKGSLIGSEGLFTTLSLLCLLIGLYALWKKASLKVFSAFIVIGVMILGLNLWIKSWNKQIVIGSVPVFEGPSVIFQARGEIPPGVLVITTTKDEWLRVLFPSRFEGWIKNADLKELK